jgi:hypothetical protein
MQLSLNSHWIAGDGQMFRIVELGDGANPWVHYENVKTAQAYSCLAEAFLFRFTRTEHDT